MKIMELIRRSNMINNQSLKFLLPIISQKSPKFYLREDFIGCYMGDLEKPQFDGKLLLVYKYPWTREFAKFNLQIESHSNYITSYDYVDQGLTVFVFNTEDFEDDYNNILEGKYSKISPENKLKISKFWYTHSYSTLTEQIMDRHLFMMTTYWTRAIKNRQNYCADGECWYIPNLDKEILDRYKF